jgi:chromosome partitioning protein
MAETMLIDEAPIEVAAEGRRPYVVVLGNEKGGSGKSTTAMHLIVALLRLGYRVGSLDLDVRRGTLSRFFACRAQSVRSGGAILPMPDHRAVDRSAASSRAEAEADERLRLDQACRELAGNDFIVIDTPGSDTYLARLAHAAADTLITPINDSLIDIDVLAQIDPVRREVLAPSTYARAVWEQNNRRVLARRPPIDWVVMRNRLAHIDAHNKREIAGLLGQLARRLGFRLAPGFGERVVFRELFLRGETVLDLPADGAASASHEAARREIAALLDAVGIVQPAGA